MQQQIPARAYCIIAGEFCPLHEKILHSCWRNGPAISLGARRTILHPTDPFTFTFVQAFDNTVY